MFAMVINIINIRCHQILLVDRCMILKRLDDLRWKKVLGSNRVAPHINNLTQIIYDTNRASLHIYK